MEVEVGSFPVSSQLTRTGPPLDWSERACTKVRGHRLAGSLRHMDVTGVRIACSLYFNRERLGQAENELPQPHPPVLLGLLKVKPEP